LVDTKQLRLSILGAACIGVNRTMICQCGTFRFARSSRR
jgi:hypothetical protein